MTKLEKKLEHWTVNKIITPDQAEQIKTFEESNQNINWAYYGFLILGALSIGIGFISIIAANWDDISSTAKLIFTFLTLLSLASFNYNLKLKDKKLGLEIGLFLFYLLCLGSIGLISQIFHTGGEFYQATLIWSIITIGIAFYSEKIVIPLIWKSFFIASVVWSIADSNWMHQYIRHNELYFTILACYISSFISVSAIKLNANNSFIKASIIVSIITYIQYIFTLDLFSNFDHKWMTSPLIIIVFLLLTVLIAFVINQSKLLKKNAIILFLILNAILLTLIYIPTVTSPKPILYALASILCLILLALIFASIKHRVLFQFILILISIRIIILYIQAFGGLAATGIGMIFSGIIIMSALFFWNKYRKQLTFWAERITS